MSHEAWDTKGDRSPWFHHLGFMERSCWRVCSVGILREPMFPEFVPPYWNPVRLRCGSRTHAFVGPCCDDRSPPLCHWYSFHDKGSTGSFPPLGQCLVTNNHHIHRISQAFWKTWPICWFGNVTSTFQIFSVVSSSLSVLCNALR